MKTYVWRSIYLKDWANGYIVVTANTVDEARDLARKHFEETVDEDKYIGPYLEDYEQEKAEWRELLEKDLQNEPEEKVILFIRGSS